MFYAGFVPQQMYQQQRQAGGWYTVKSFNDVQNMPLPVDGSQTMFMLEDEPTFYICSVINGRKVVQGYSFTPIEQEKNISLEDIAKQIQQLTTLVSKHDSVIKELGGADDESNIPG